MALQNTDFFLVNRAGTGHRLAWSELQSTTEGSLQVQDVFTYTGTTGATTAAQTDVPVIVDQGIRLPVAGTGDYNVDGAIRYSPANSKLEMYYGGAWNTASGGTAFGATPPFPATEGDVWYDTDNGRSYVYYYDGTSSQWVEMNPAWDGGTPPDSIGTTELADESVTPAKLASSGLIDFSSTGVGIGEAVSGDVPLSIRRPNLSTVANIVTLTQAVDDGSVELATKFKMTPGDGKFRIVTTHTDPAISPQFRVDVGDQSSVLVADGNSTNKGRVGINTDTPENTLHVKSTVQSQVAMFESSVANGEGVGISRIEFANSDTISSGNRVVCGSRADSFSIHTGPLLNTRLLVGPAGKVAIGTLEPTELLTVAGGNVIVGQESGDNTGIKNYIKFGRTEGAKAAIGFHNNLSNGRGDLIFMVDGDSNSNGFTDADERMRITNGGVQVTGGVTSSGNLSANGGIVSLRGNSAQVVFKEDGTTYGNEQWAIIRDSDSMSLRWKNAAPYAWSATTSSGAVNMVKIMQNAYTFTQDESVFNGNLKVEGHSSYFGDTDNTSNRTIIDSTGGITSKRTYNLTNSNTTNLVRITSGGLLQRSTSSRRYKDNIRDLDTAVGGLDVITKLTSRQWEDHTNGEHCTGLVAEEVHAAGAHLGVAWDEWSSEVPQNGSKPVTKDGSKAKEGDLVVDGINDRGLIMHLVEAVKELKAENDALKARLDEAGL